MDGSGDGEGGGEKLKILNKKLSKGENKGNKGKHIKEFGSYVHDGKSNKVEFSEEDQNPYHKQNKGKIF